MNETITRHENGKMKTRTTYHTYKGKVYEGKIYETVRFYSTSGICYQVFNRPYNLFNRPVN